MNMKVRAKFIVNSITKRKGWGENPWVYDIGMQPVTGGSEENKRFFAATPSGDVRLSTVNETAANHFEPGEEYYITFNKAKEIALATED